MAGTHVIGTAQFVDPDGDLEKVLVDVTSTPTNVQAQGRTEVPLDVADATEGTIGQGFYNCPAAGPPGCNAGRVTATVTLQDKAGNQSEPSTFSFDVTNEAPVLSAAEIPSPIPAGDPVDARVSFTDAEGNVVGLEFQVVSDPNHVIPPTSIVNRPDLLFAKTAGTIKIDKIFVCPVNTCATGKVAADVRLRDLAGNRSQPKRVSFEIVDDNPAPNAGALGRASFVPGI
ncbi:MAG TPA: hypothetical protein VFW66_01455 [Gemmatimonadales bacterium]|nr:hypothetical protein [Gemmatimonadales bacterium]